MIIHTKVQPEPCFKHGLHGQMTCPECCYRLLTFLKNNKVNFVTDGATKILYKKQSDKYKKADKELEIWFSKWLRPS